VASPRRGLFPNEQLGEAALHRDATTNPQVSQINTEILNHEKNPHIRGLCFVKISTNFKQ